MSNLSDTPDAGLPVPAWPGGSIREAAADDAPAIECLYRELVSDPSIQVLPAQVAALSASPTSFLLVAEVAGAIGATALLTICPDAMYRAQPFGVVENVVVTVALRGRGVGRILLAHIEQMAIAHDCTKLMLLSSQTRHDAHAFFRRCGFTSDTKHAFVKYRREFAAGIKHCLPVIQNL
jgi:N-acetylglutamate synthase-like GNAT family acetyltransferase